MRCCIESGTRRVVAGGDEIIPFVTLGERAQRLEGEQVEPAEIVLVTEGQAVEIAREGLRVDAHARAPEAGESRHTARVPGGVFAK